MIGFIGLGIMGKPMVKNLLKAGVQVRVNDLVQSAVDEVAALGALPSTQAQIGADCDVVFTILPNGAIVQNVLFGENGVASTLRQGALVVDMSSVTPGSTYMGTVSVLRKRHFLQNISAFRSRAHTFR